MQASTRWSSSGVREARSQLLSDHFFSSFAFRKASTVLNALKNSRLPENDKGLTGPMVINEYCRLFGLKAE